MQAEITHIECGIFNGIIILKLEDKCLKFELGTPNYNDYSEYRVDAPFNAYSDDLEIESKPFDETMRGFVPEDNMFIELTEEQANFWLTNIHDEPTEFMKEWVVCGKLYKEGFHVFAGNEMVKFEDWQKLDSDAYEYLMFNLLHIFFKFYNSKDCPKNFGLTIYQ